MSESTGHEDRENNEASSKTKPEMPSSEPPPSADDTPQQHGITDQLVNVFLKRFLPEDVRFTVKGYKYRAVANIGEGYTSTRKVLEVTYLDQLSGNDQVAAFIVKLSGNH